MNLLSKNKQVCFGACIGLFLACSSYATASQNIGTQISDTAVTTNLMTQYAKDPLLNPFKISVTTNNGTVNLSGTVNTKMQYERAVELAESVNGSQDVNANKLKVKNSNAPLSDSFITAKINGVLLKGKIFTGDEISFWPVHVETKNGVVYVSGTVDSAMQKTNVLNAIKNVQGVKSIKQDLTIVDSNQQ